MKADAGPRRYLSFSALDGQACTRAVFPVDVLVRPYDDTTVCPLNLSPLVRVSVPVWDVRDAKLAAFWQRPHSKDGHGRSRGGRILYAHPPQEILAEYPTTAEVSEDQDSRAGFDACSFLYKDIVGTGSLGPEITLPPAQEQF